VEDARGRWLLVDIEGTTTPIDFVTRVLFPYARAHAAAFLTEHAALPEGREDLARLEAEHRADAASGAAPPPWEADTPERALDSALAYVGWLMDRDRKSTALKALQGEIWHAGYRRGELRGSVYPDVPPAFARWSAQGRRIAIFSSGSVLAQKLLFSTCPEGDLTQSLGAYFDTTTGGKREPSSYRRIADLLGETAGAILFLSDVAEECDAARDAGVAAALVLRAGAEAPSATPHRIVRSFDEVFPEAGDRRSGAR